MKPTRKPAPRMWYRSDEIRRIRGDLLLRSSPRLHMALLVSFTGAAGLLASFLLLRAGLETMWLRYLSAFGLAYLVFLLLLWVWLRWREWDNSPDPSDAYSGGGGSDGGSCGPDGDFGGGGGEFGGGGASSSWDSLDAPLPSGGGGGGGGGDGDLLGSAGDALGAADEAAIPLLLLLALLAAIAAMLGGAFVLINSAPELFAELLLDGVLSVSLYRRLRGIHTRHWLETAVHRTALPFLIAALVVAGTGFGMALYAPEAHSLGEVVYHAKHPAARE